VRLDWAECKSTGFHSGYQGVICFDFYSQAAARDTELLRVDVEAVCTTTGGVDVRCKSAVATWTAGWLSNGVPVSLGSTTGRCVPSGPACSNTRTVWTGNNGNQPIHIGHCGTWSATLASTGFTFPNNIQWSFSNWSVSTTYCTGS
jgi:hypothetical protein